jgi:4-oxalocrotonate tautomerase
MPVVTVQVTREGTFPGADGTTPAQKARIFKGISDLMLDVLGKDPDDTWIVFEEVEMENWGRGGLSVPEYRRVKSSVAASDLMPPKGGQRPPST